MLGSWLKGTTNDASCKGAPQARHNGAMQVPVMPSVKPMIATSVPELPEGDYVDEPTWDGLGRRSPLRAGSTS